MSEAARGWISDIAASWRTARQAEAAGGEVARPPSGEATAEAAASTSRRRAATVAMLGRRRRLIRRAADSAGAAAGVSAPHWAQVAHSWLLRHRWKMAKNCATLGALYALAEVSQQTLNREFNRRKTATTAADLKAGQQQYDVDSVKRYALVGSALYGPLFHTWYSWLDSRFAGTAAAVVARKAALDQFALGPVALALFYVSMSALEGKRGADDLLAECRSKFWATYAADCAFWIPVQAVNFAFVSPARRVLYLGVAMFTWLNVLCVAKNYESYVSAVPAESAGEDGVAGGVPCAVG